MLGKFTRTAKIEGYADSVELIDNLIEAVGFEYEESPKAVGKDGFYFKAVSTIEVRYERTYSNNYYEPDDYDEWSEWDEGEIINKVYDAIDDIDTFDITVSVKDNDDLEEIGDDRY